MGCAFSKHCQRRLKAKKVQNAAHSLEVEPNQALAGVITAEPKAGVKLENLVLSNNSIENIRVGSRKDDGDNENEQEFELQKFILRNAISTASETYDDAMEVIPIPVSVVVAVESGFGDKKRSTGSNGSHVSDDEVEVLSPDKGQSICSFPSKVCAFNKLTVEIKNDFPNLYGGGDGNNVCNQNMILQFPDAKVATPLTPTHAKLTTIQKNVSQWLESISADDYSKPDLTDDEPAPTLPASPVPVKKPQDATSWWIGDLPGSVNANTCSLAPSKLPSIDPPILFQTPQKQAAVENNSFDESKPSLEKSRSESSNSENDSPNIEKTKNNLGITSCCDSDMKNSDIYGISPKILTQSAKRFSHSQYRQERIPSFMLAPSPVPGSVQSAEPKMREIHQAQNGYSTIIQANFNQDLSERKSQSSKVSSETYVVSPASAAHKFPTIASPFSRPYGGAKTLEDLVKIFAPNRKQVINESGDSVQNGSRNDEICAGLSRILEVEEGEDLGHEHYFETPKFHISTSSSSSTSLAQSNSSSSSSSGSSDSDFEKYITKKN